MFNVFSLSKNFPSVRCAADVVFREVDIFGNETVLLAHILYNIRLNYQLLKYKLHSGLIYMYIQYFCSRHCGLHDYTN
jgi:hypothetical protein